MTAALPIPSGLVRDHPVLIELLRRAMYRRMTHMTFSAEAQDYFVEAGVRELCNSGLYVDDAGRLHLPELTLH